MTGYTLDCQSSIAGVGTDGSLRHCLHVIDVFWKWYQGKGTVVHVNVIEACGGVETELHSFLTSALGGVWSSCPRALHPQERKPVPIECVLVGPRSGVDVLEKRKNVMKIRFYRGAYILQKSSRRRPEFSCYVGQALGICASLIRSEAHGESYWLCQRAWLLPWNYVLPYVVIECARVLRQMWNW